MREARGLLGDVKKAVGQLEQWITASVGKRLAALDERIDDVIARRVKDAADKAHKATTVEFVRLVVQMRSHMDKADDIVRDRLAYMTAMCGAPDIVKYVAVGVLGKAGGSVEAPDGKSTYHLLRETTAPDGRRGWKLGDTLANRSRGDQELIQAIADAVAAVRPDVHRFEFMVDGNLSEPFTANPKR